MSLSNDDDDDGGAGAGVRQNIDTYSLAFDCHARRTVIEFASVTFLLPLRFSSTIYANIKKDREHSRTTIYKLYTSDIGCQFSQMTFNIVKI